MRQGSNLPEEDRLVCGGTPFLYEHVVVGALRMFSMSALVLSGNTLTLNPSARYATDVTFQQSDIPSGVMKERSGYFSAKTPPTWLQDGGFGAPKRPRCKQHQPLPRRRKRHRHLPRQRGVLPPLKCLRWQTLQRRRTWRMAESSRKSPRTRGRCWRTRVTRAWRRTFAL